MATQQMQRAFGVEFLDQIIEWVIENLSPEEIYNEADLARWAKDEGWVKVADLPAEVQEMLP